MALRPALRPALFIDKDGTLVDDVPYNVDVARVRLANGAGRALRTFAQRGWGLVVVTNQPGVALGRFDEAALVRVERRLGALLAPFGVRLDGMVWCPHAAHPDGRPTCLCRKPMPGMLFAAAQRFGLDLSASWMIGDILDDIEAGHRAGCRSMLLDVGHETEWRRSRLRLPDGVVRTWADAACAMLAEDMVG